MLSGALFLLQQFCLPGVPALGNAGITGQQPATPALSRCLPPKYEDAFTLVPTKESPWPAGEAWPEDTSSKTD